MFLGLVRSSGRFSPSHGQHRIPQNEEGTRSCEYQRLADTFHTSLFSVVQSHRKRLLGCKTCLPVSKRLQLGLRSLFWGSASCCRSKRFCKCDSRARCSVFQACRQGVPLRNITNAHERNLNKHKDTLYYYQQ